MIRKGVYMLGSILKDFLIQVAFFLFVMIGLLAYIPEYIREREERSRLQQTVEEIMSSPEMQRELCEPLNPESHYSSTDVVQDRYFPLRI